MATIDEQLWDACRYGDLGKVKSALSAGAETDWHNEVEGWNSIMVACKYNHSHIVRYLIENSDIDMNTIYEAFDGFTAVMLACYRNSVNTVKVLIENTDIDVNIGTKIGWTCIMWAVFQNHFDTVKLLIEHTDVNVVDNDGLSCLMLAGIRSTIEVDIVKILIENMDSDVNVCNNDGDNALMLACYNNRFDCVRLILRKRKEIEINKQGKNGNTCLMLACGSISKDDTYSTKIVKLILGYSSDVNLDIKNKKNNTALDIARVAGRTEVSELILIEERRREQKNARERANIDIDKMIEETQGLEEKKKKKKKKRKKGKSLVEKEATALNNDNSEINQGETLSYTDLLDQNPDSNREVASRRSTSPFLDTCVETSPKTISTNDIEPEKEKVIGERHISVEEESFKQLCEIDDNIEVKDKDVLRLNFERKKKADLIKEKNELVRKENYIIQSLINSKSTEKTNLILLGDRAENSANLKLKEITNNDEKILEYESIIDKLREENKIAKNEHQQCVEHAQKLSKQQKELDDYIAAKMEQSSMEVRKIDHEIMDLRSSIENIDKKLEKIANCGSLSDEPVNDQSQYLFSFIDDQIAEKEDELECPVCLEICTSSPIFMCEEMHLICPTCRPNVIKCPQCRKEYKCPSRRHRFAEKTLEELAKLRIQRRKLKKATDFTS